MLLIELSYHDVPGGAAGQPVSDLVSQSSHAEWAKDWVKRIAENPEKYPNISSLTLTAYENDNDGGGGPNSSGMVAYVFAQNGAAIELFRGTQDGKDWSEDAIGAALGDNAQVEAAKRFDQQYGGGYSSVCLMGHSLGGGLAIAVLMEHVLDTKYYAWTINSALFGPTAVLGSPVISAIEWAELTMLAESGRLFCVVGEHDALSHSPWGTLALAQVNGLVYHDRFSFTDWSDAHMPWHNDYNGFIGQLRNHSPRGSGPGLYGHPMAVDTLRSAEAASRLHAALALHDEMERSVDRIGRALIEDALDLRRDGDVKAALGRHLAIAATTPMLASIIVPLADEIKAGLTFAAIDIHIHLDRQLTRAKMQQIETYVRSIGPAFDACEQHVLSEASRLS